MDIIAKNPYRYLGVYSNSPIRERVANRGKMKAFLKVGKAISFPVDFPNILPVISRSTDTVADAESQLALPIDRIRFAQYWWMNLTPLDSIAFNHLANGNTDMAKTIWDKKANVSSLQNNFVLSCVNEDWTSAIRYAEVLYADFSEDFIAQIVGNDISIDTPLWQMLIDSFHEAKVDIQSFMDVITDTRWRNYVAEKTINPLIDAITNAIGTAKASKGKGSDLRLQAGKKLMASTKSPLAKLRTILPASDIRYQTIADKLGLEILQCGIDYYNGADAADAAQKAMKLQSYALSVVVGKMAKDRCQENVDILKNIIKNLPPMEVFAEDKAIKKELHEFCGLPDKICHSINLLNRTKVHLQSIKAKLGAANAYYLKISTIVVGNALHNVIEEVNAVQKNAVQNSPYLGTPLLLMQTLKSAWEATEIMDTFDMESGFKTDRYNGNRSTLQSMCRQLGIPTTTYIPHPSASRPMPVPNQSSTTHSNSTSSSNEGPSGCLIAFIAWVVIGCIAGGICVANDGDFSAGFAISGVIVLAFSSIVH